MRVPGYGLVDTDTRVPFTFDGVTHVGHPGDTLASALLANGVRLVGRSFKYHRPRGFVTAGSDDPNGLFTVQGMPNTRATVQELYGGLTATSQNRWPSLSFDALEINDLVAPFLSAGFYYKTFMWPRGFWERVYEPVIRRAAGLGKLDINMPVRAAERAFAHTDILVIGGGPAGLSAALVAARSGADVILADEDARMGGRLLSETCEIDGKSGVAWTDAILDELRAFPNVRLMPRTTVTGVYDGGIYGALERVSSHLKASGDAPREAFWRITAERVILAAGAQERAIAFPDNDRPGVMTASAVRTFLHRFGVAPGRKIAVFGCTDDVARTVRDLDAAGIGIAAAIDTRPDADLPDATRTFRGAHVTGVSGRLGMRGLKVTEGATEHLIEADCLAVAGGWNPAVHLSCHMNGRPRWNEDIAGFVPQENAVPGLVAVGAANGTFDTSGCLDEGARAAVEAVKMLGLTPAEVPARDAEAQPYRIAPVWHVPGKGRAWLDFQNDVTTKDVSLAAQENFASVEHMKRYTTQGMATDQGKGSNVTALAILADATGRGIPGTGTTTFRPPYTPVPIAAGGAGGEGVGFAPQRFTAAHDQGLALGAPMIEAGLWYRPSYFPKPGESDWLTSCNREVGYVRSAVGVADVSTLGKIDIQGPDAARFLDFVYTNTISSLAEGRVRYGLMLREDGFVMDDGTVARLGPQHYLITTTTAAAGQVMAHLEFVHQCLRPEWNLRMVSVTEQWSQYSLAGSRARDLLASVTGTDLDRGDWPFMSCGPVDLAGVAARVFRISFSGEEGFEVAVPARYGATLFKELVAGAEALGGGPYGMEALNVLRIEKGFLTHAEIQGRATAFDVGLQGMLSRKKDFIGRAAATRPGLLDARRHRLVGLRPVNPENPINAGAHLFKRDAEPVRENSEGFVSSACWSPTLNSHLALAFLFGGPDRMGETVKMVDHLRKEVTLCVVSDPVAFDPEGGRMRD